MDLAKTYPKKVKTKKGREITLKLPVMGDAKRLMDYINTLVNENALILKNEEVKKLEDEKEYLVDLLKNVNAKKSINVLGFYNSRLIANTGVSAGKFREKHVGNLGISVNKDFRGEGIGYLLIKEILMLSKKYLNLKKVTLAVMDGNKGGIHLYKKIGFKEYGRLPKAYLYKDSYIDEILMYKDL